MKASCDEHAGKGTRRVATSFDHLIDPRVTGSAIAPCTAGSRYLPHRRRAAIDGRFHLAARDRFADADVHSSASTRKIMNTVIDCKARPSRKPKTPPPHPRSRTTPVGI